MLIGILVPVLNKVKQQAKAVICRSNLKQLALAMTVYEQKNEVFPHGFDDSELFTVIPPGGYPGNNSYDLLGWWWFHSLSGSGVRGGNYDKGTILWCPSRSLIDLSLKTNVLCVNYGVNRAICKDAPETTGISSEFIGTPLGLYEIRRPAETLLITDSGYSLISWRGASNASGPYFDNPDRESSFYVPGLRINKERTLTSGCEQDAINGRHPGKTVNVGFTDGHISCVNADDLFVEEISGSYSNRSPLWLPKWNRAD